MGRAHSSSSGSADTEEWLEVSKAAAERILVAARVPEYQLGRTKVGVQGAY